MVFRERSLTIGGRGGGGVLGGLKFSGSAFREGLQVLGAFARCARINGFCVTEL